MIRKQPVAAAAGMKDLALGEYILVDEALFRDARGLAGVLIVEGPEQPEIFRESSGEELWRLGRQTIAGCNAANTSLAPVLLDRITKPQQS